MKFHSPCPNRLAAQQPGSTHSLIGILDANENTDLKKPVQFIPIGNGIKVCKGDVTQNWLGITTLIGLGKYNSGGVSSPATAGS